MATSEFDPLFVKGLRLLHSKSKDSVDQLKLLLDEVIVQSKQSNPKDRIYTSIKLEGESKLHLKKASRDTTETSTYSKHSTDDRERKADKRQSDKSKQDSFESDAKIPKLDPAQGYSYYPSSPYNPSSPDLPKLDQYVTKKEDDTESSDDNAETDDFTMEIMEMGLACVICNQIEVTQGNQLIECQECHSLYHQECHRPPATDHDVNDPRKVWYCAKCVKNMKKMATKNQKSAKSSSSVPTKEPVSQTKNTKSESSAPSLMLPFKRTELKTPISQGSAQTTANKPIGLASLAANFGGRTTTTSASTSSASSTRGAKPSSGINLKTAFSSSATSKTSSISSSNLSKTSSSSAFQNLSSSLTTSSQSSTSSSSQKSSTSSSATKGLGLLSATVASTSSRTAASAASGNGNNSHKVASCSPLMSADKRLQIMKKKASKLQERRRMSNK